MNPYRLLDGRPRRTREQQVLFESDRVAVGLFDARPDDPHFRFSGLPGEHLFVFPATSVVIERRGEEPFVADRNLAVLYNPDQHYTRSEVSPRGDRGHWFALAPEAMTAILPAPAAADETGWFRRRRAVVDSRSWIAQLGIVRRLTGGEPVDGAAVERAVLALGRRVLDAAGTPGAATAADSHRDLAERARRLLAARYDRPERLADLASRLDASPSHLSRVFHRVTGSTLQAHREQLRLRRAWVELPYRRGDLTGLALDLGYSSHAHFTAAFRAAFGSPPSRVGAAGGGQS